MKIRNAVVEGRFYPSTKSRIFEQIREIESASRYPITEVTPVRIFGAVLPHAGHMYSGYQTVPLFQLMQKLDLRPDTFIIVHPNHSGHGLPLAIHDADIWCNSAGDVPMDREFAEAMDLPYDHMAHANEHSAEVIIPFLQYYFTDYNFSILPVCMSDQSLKSASKVAKQIKLAASETGRNIMVLASCDFSHFLPPQEGKKRDQLVIDNILARNTAGVETAVKQFHVSVCGYGPIMSLMEYTDAHWPEYNVQILARGNSGEVHPSPEVVDYVSMILYQ